MTDLLWVKPALLARGSALTEEIRQDDRRENDFCVGSPTVFSRERSGAPDVTVKLRNVLFLPFWILGFLIGRILVGQVCVARTRLLR